MVYTVYTAKMTRFKWGVLEQHGYNTASHKPPAICTAFPTQALVACLSVLTTTKTRTAVQTSLSMSAIISGPVQV